MIMTASTIRALSAIILLAQAASTADPVRAAVPAFSGCGKFLKDNAADAAADPIADPAPKETEIEAVWVDAGGSKPTINLQIADLTGKVPPPATSIKYLLGYRFAPETVHNVQAFLDFSGAVVFEYGHVETVGPFRGFKYEGDLEGELFTGEHGVVRMAMPANAGAKPGSVLNDVTAFAQSGRTGIVPSAINQLPTRGTVVTNDEVQLGRVTVTDCVASGGSPPPRPTTVPSGASSPVGPAPVTLLTKNLRPAKAKKAVKVRVRTTEPLSDVAFRLSKGTRVFGTARLVKLKRSGTVTFRLKKALRKGAYALDVAGTDGEGRRRLASLKIRVS